MNDWLQRRLLESLGLEGHPVFCNVCGCLHAQSKKPMPKGYPCPLCMALTAPWN